MNRDGLRLLHIRDAILRIQSYSPDRSTFLSSTLVQDAILRNLEIIGEAVKALDEETRKRRPEIPWARISAMRDRLVHGYFSVDLDLVWEVVTEHLNPLAEAVDDLLASGR